MGFFIVIYAVDEASERSGGNLNSSKVFILCFMLSVKYKEIFLCTSTSNKKVRRVVNRIYFTNKNFHLYLLGEEGERKKMAGFQYHKPKSRKSIPV